MKKFKILNVNILTGLRVPPMTGLKNMFQCAHFVLIGKCLAEVLDSFVDLIYCRNDK